MAELTVEKLDSLDALAERIDRAVDALSKLRADNTRLSRRVEELEAKLGEGEKQLQGRTFSELQGELESLRGAERLWATERKEIAHRVDELIQKLDRLGD